MEQLVAPFP